MYRKPRRRTPAGALSLDSLMDILSCLVGVMLFLVIYTVLELGSTSYEARVPALREPPQESRMVVVVAQGRTARVMDVNDALGDLLTGIDIVRTVDLPTFVDQANRRPVTDGFFTYSLAQRDGLASSTEPVQALNLRIDVQSEAVGDSIHQVVPGSTFHRSLDRLDPERAWLVFAVDSASVDVFRKARQMAVERGFSVDWRPSSLEFPLTHGLTARLADERLLASGAPIKPAR